MPEGIKSDTRALMQYKIIPSSGKIIAMQRGMQGFMTL